MVVKVKSKPKSIQFKINIFAFYPIKFLGLEFHENKHGSRGHFRSIVSLERASIRMLSRFY
jgi:hypothetical protein